MVDDAVLSREAAYIYQYAVGFEPVEGSLRKWQGTVQDSRGQSAKLLVTIPESFPYDPPKLKLEGSTTHALVNEDGELVTRTISRWSQNNRVYSVIKEASQALKSSTFKSIEKIDQKQTKDVLKNQISLLENKIEQKKNEYEKLKNTSVQNMDVEKSEKELIESSMVELENEAYAIEDAYDNLEIKAIEFAKKFVDVRKRYYLIEKAQ